MIRPASMTPNFSSMTGRRLSNAIVRCGALGACVLAGWLSADEVVLSGGARLTGAVRSLSEAGVVELASELAPEPVRLEPGAVTQIDFSAKGAGPPPPAAVVEMINGDRLPATLEALDDRQLTVVSPEAGRLEIPRAAVKSLRFGVRSHQAVYAGPRALDEWTHGEGEAKNWVFEHGSLIASGPATACQALTLPEQFILRLTLKWQAKQTPSFQVFFADPLKPKGEACDRYYLLFGGAGVELKREASQGKRFHTLAQLNRLPSQYPDHQLQLELRVDRKGSRLQLLLNGEPEGEFLDPLPAAPQGSGVTLASTAPNGNTLEIRDLEILELDDPRGRPHPAERGDPQADSLLSREDDRWGGQLLDLRQTGDGPVFRFQARAPADLLEIPVADVATVFFAAKDAAPSAAAAHPFVLRLRWDGALRVGSCQFNEDVGVASHPLLGRLSLRREGIVSLERLPPQPPTAPQP